MSARPDIRQISLTSPAAGPPTGASASSGVSGPPGGPNGPVAHTYHNIHSQRHPITQRPQPGSAYMPINVDGSPGRSLRGGPPGSGSIQVSAPPQILGRSGSPANGPGSAASATAGIRTPYSNYAVASAVAQANSKGIAPPHGAPMDQVRYYQGVAAAAAANTIPAVATIGQNFHSRGDPSATVFVRNAVDRISTAVSDMGRSGTGIAPPPASTPSSVSGRMTLRPYHPPQQTIYPQTNATAIAETFQKQRKLQNTAFSSSTLTSLSSVDSATEGFNSSSFKMRMDSESSPNNRTNRGSQESTGGFDSKQFDRATESLKKKQISSLLTAKSTPSTSFKKSLLQKEFTPTCGATENPSTSKASHAVRNILHNPHHASPTLPSTLGDSKDGSKESVTLGSGDKYGPVGKANNFSTTFKRYNVPQTDGDGLYSMSSAHVSDEGRSFLHQISQAQRRGSFPSLSTQGMSSSHLNNQGPLLGYPPNFQQPDGQSFDGFYSKGGYPNLAFHSLHMASKSNNRNNKTSITRNMDSESSDSLRYRFSSNNYINSFAEDKRGLHNFGSKSSNDSNSFHSSLSYHLADKFSRRLFSPSGEGTYLRDPITMAAVASGGGLPVSGRDLGPSISTVHHPSLHPGIHPAPLSSRVAPSPGASSAANASSGGLSEVPSIAKRPRMEMGGPIHHQGVSHGQPPPLSHGQPPQHPSHLQPTSSMTPLRIDTREAKKDSGYHPTVEAISPTGPEATGERDDHIRSTKDDLLQKITKVDREIAKAESQIAKLRKKQQELEDTTSKPLSDTNDEEEKPRNQSIAQIVYADNRKKARSSHQQLEKFNPRRMLGMIHEGNELPMYNQPSDTHLYHVNKRNHTYFKRTLVERFKKRNEEKEARERYMTETYTKMMATWSKKCEKIENSKRRKEREAKARELYEKIFPEIRKLREDKERDHRLGTRGTVRSEADIEDVIERLQEQEMEDKKMHSYAVIPPLLLPPDERRRKFTNNNGLILDPLREYNERKFVNTWTDSEKEIFKEKYLLHPKNFGQIAQFLERKTVSDCVQYYYLSKKTENYKQLLRKSTKGRRGGRTVRGLAGLNVNDTTSGVQTRNRNKENNNGNNDRDNGDSNRSTPNMKPEPKEEPKDDDDKKTSKGKDSRNDTSDEEEGSQTVKSGPHSCCCCKATVEKSRPVNKSLASILGLKDEDMATDFPRVCNSCYMKSQRKKHGHCPIPTCTSTKGRNKGRLRHMPAKWTDLPKDVREAIANELQIPDGTKKICSACLTRLTRKITQVTGTSENHKPTSEERLGTEVLLWREDEIETLKGCLRNSGKNWSLMSESLNKTKSPEQCKKFFYGQRKKYQLDKLVLEYKRANQSVDHPPSLSTDEESGSSTSSCDEDGGLPQSQISSGRNSPARRANSASGTNSTDMKPPIKVENNSTSSTTNLDNNASSSGVKSEVKSEIKTEEKVEPIGNSVGGAGPVVGARGAVSHQVPARPISTSNTTVKEEEYDSSATMSADERETETSRGSSNHVQGYIVHSSPSTIYQSHQITAAQVSSSLVQPAPGLSIRSSAPIPSELLIRAGHPVPVGSQASLGIVQGGAALVRAPPFPTSHDNLRSKPPGVYGHDIRQQLPPPTSMRPPQSIPSHVSTTMPGQATVLHPGSAHITNGPASQILTVKDLMINVIEKSLSTTKGNSVGGQVGNNGNGGITSSGSHPSHPQEGPNSVQVPPPSPTIHNLLANSGPPPHKTNYIRDGVGLNPQPQIHTSRAQPISLHTQSSQKPPAVMQFAAISAVQQQSGGAAGSQHSVNSAGKKIIVNGPQSMAPPVARSVPTQGSSDCETLDLSMPSRRRDVTPPPSHSQMPPQGGYREPNQHPRHPRSSPVGEGYTSQSGNRAPPPAHSSKVSTAPDSYLRAPNDSRQAHSPAGHLQERHLTTPPGHHISSRQSPGLGHGRNVPASITSQLPSRHGDSRPGSSSGLQYAGSIQRQIGPSSSIQQIKNASISPKLPGKIDRPLTINTGSITQGTPMSQIPVSHLNASRGYDNLLKVTPTEKAPTGSITHGTPVYEKKHQTIVAHPDIATRPGGAFPDRSISSEMLRRSTVSPSSAYPGYVSSSNIASTVASSSQGSSRAYANEPHMSSRQVLMNDYALARSADMQRRPESREFLPRPLSPPRLPSSRDPSPRPRSSLIVTDPRAAQLDIRGNNSSRDIQGRTDGRYDHRLDPRMMGDPKAEMRSLEHRSEPRASLHDLRGDPRMGLDPRGDPRAGLEIRHDQRTSLDPRAVPDHRTDLRLQSHDLRRTDGRPSSGGLIDRDPRPIIDPRSTDHRIDPRIAVDHRMEHTDSRRSTGYYGHQQSQQPQQIYLSSDGKYVTHPIASREIPRGARSPPRSTPPPSISVRASANMPPVATIHQRPGLTSGKPIVSKAVASASSGISHREVEIYRTHPEVTISKTSSPRHGYNDQNPLASLVDVAIQQAKLPDIKGDRDVRSLTASSAGPGSSSASIHYQQSRQLPPNSSHLYDSRQRFDLHDGEKPRRDGPTDLQRERSYGGSNSGHQQPPHDPSQLVQQVQHERSKQQYFLLQGDRAAVNQSSVSQSVGSAARLATSAERAKAASMVPLPRPSVSNNVGNQGDSAAVIVNERCIRGSSAASQPPLSVARVSDAGDPGVVRTVSAATLIDAVITQAINSGTPPDGGILPPGASVKQISQFKRSPNMNTQPGASSSHPTEIMIDSKGSPYKAPSRSPSVKSDGNNGPTDVEGHQTAPGSRPGSRSSSIAATEGSGRPITLGENVDRVINKDLQIHPATSTPPSSTSVPQRSSTENSNSGTETYWKRNRYHNTSDNPSSLSIIASHQNSLDHSASIPSSTNSRITIVPGNGGPSNNSVADERQITRVPQSPSPKSQNSNPLPPGSSRIEPISPPNSRSMPSETPVSTHPRHTPPISSSGDPISRFLDARKRPVSAGPQGNQSQQPVSQNPSNPSHQDGQGVGPGLSPLDYVKNKIVEEMTKGEGSTGSSNSSNINASSPNQTVTGVKRPLSGQEDNISKKPCISGPVSSNNSNDIPPDSPGSPGEMVIDETARPDSVSSHKTASPAPNQINATSATSLSSNVASSGLSAISTSNAPTGASSSSLHSTARYEPLSDDE